MFEFYYISQSLVDNIDLCDIPFVFEIKKYYFYINFFLNQYHYSYYIYIQIINEYPMYK